MNRKLIMSILVILVAIVATIGGTMAWFTDQVEIAPNEFEAGTVRLRAQDSWADEVGLVVNNWNPGDCSPKYMAVEYFGTKRAFIRMQIDASWEGELPATNVVWKKYVGEAEYADLYNSDGEWIFDYIDEGYSSLSEWFNDANEWVNYDIDDDPKWKKYEGWYYYDGDDEDTTLILSEGPPAITVNALSGQSEEEPFLIAFMHAVCLKGAETGNAYQGKVYSISATFQAIQASHAGDWNWSDVVPYNE